MSVPRIAAIATVTAATAAGLLGAGPAAANKVFDATVTGRSGSFAVKVVNHTTPELLCRFDATAQGGATKQKPRLFPAKAGTTTVTVKATAPGQAWNWTVKCLTAANGKAVALTEKGTARA